MLLCAALLFAGVMWAPLPAGGQSDGQAAGQEAIPVLVSGPTRTGELPFLPPNAIESYRGLYELPEQNVRVYHTYREIVPLSGWEELSCGDYRLLSFRGEIANQDDIAGGGPGPIGEIPIAFYEGDDFYLFYAFLGGEVSCGFIETFMRKFMYFRGLGSGQSRQGRPPFPAVLDD